MAFVPYWAKSACLKGADADTLFRTVPAAEREPDVNTFPMTGSSTRFNLLFRLNWEGPEVPMLYLGITEDGRGMDLPQPGSRLPLAGCRQAVRAPEEVYSSLAAAAPEA